MFLYWLLIESKQQITVLCSTFLIPSKNVEVSIVQCWFSINGVIKSLRYMPKLQLWVSMEEGIGRNNGTDSLGNNWEPNG